MNHQTSRRWRTVVRALVVLVVATLAGCDALYADRLEGSYSIVNECGYPLEFLAQRDREPTLDGGFRTVRVEDGHSYGGGLLRVPATIHVLAIGPEGEESRFRFFATDSEPDPEFVLTGESCPR